MTKEPSAKEGPKVRTGFWKGFAFARHAVANVRDSTPMLTTCFAFLRHPIFNFWALLDPASSATSIQRKHRENTSDTPSNCRVGATSDAKIEVWKPRTAVLNKFDM